MENKEINIKEAKRIYKENQGKIKEDADGGFVELSNISKVYDNNFQAVYDFNLSVEKGQFVALVGPSGCGKSTVLRMIAGLEEITQGKLVINNVLSNYLPSKDRDIAMVFQSYALYPQLSVYDNIAFGLKMRKVPKEEIKEKVFTAAKILDLGHYLDSLPKQLSGGQMQRVALGRAIVRDASIFLMDEPLSNLDAKLRVQMRSEIVRIHEEVGATTIYVTHDQTEAMTMADNIVVMNKGFVQQHGKPMDVYLDPNNLFVATFIGSPSMNLLSCIYEKGQVTLDNGHVIKLSAKSIKQHDKFYKDCLEKNNELLSLVDENPSFVKEELLRMKSHLINEKKEEIVHKKEPKFKLIRRFIKFIKTRKEGKKNQIDEQDVLKEKINEYINHYQSCISGNSHSIILGIRPEDVHLATNKETSMQMAISQIEVLGSEFIVYGTSSGYDLKFKVQGSCPFENKNECHVELDVKKIHLFDCLSGLKINKTLN